jgi:hypothetical protein
MPRRTHREARWRFAGRPSLRFSISLKRLLAFALRPWEPIRLCDGARKVVVWILLSNGFEPGLGQSPGIEVFQCRTPVDEIIPRD